MPLAACVAVIHNSKNGGKDKSVREFRPPDAPAIHRLFTHSSTATHATNCRQQADAGAADTNVSAFFTFAKPWSKAVCGKWLNRRSLLGDGTFLAELTDAALEFCAVLDSTRVEAQ
jgi:hypothetical protein